MSTDQAAPPTLILLVRHGQTPTTGKVLPGRAPGLHLSEHGRGQAESVAERLAVLGISAIYCSPLERTMETAAPTAERTGLDVHEEPGLLEGDFGDWTGAALAELTKLDQWTTVQREPDQFRFPNGESFTEIRDRMATTLAGIRSQHPGEVVVCFSHADPIRITVSEALGSPLNRFQRISVSPCSVSAVAYPQPTTEFPSSELSIAEQPVPDPQVLTVNSTQDSLADLRAS